MKKTIIYKSSLVISLLIVSLVLTKNTYAVPGIIEVCQNCQYTSLQAAVEAETEGTKVVVKSNLSGSDALLNVTFLTSPHTVNIQCNSDVTLNANNSPYLIFGNMQRDFKMTGCTLTGATDFAVNLSTPKSVILKKNIFYDAPVKTSTNTGSVYDSNAFINSRLIHGLGYTSIINNTFNSTTGSTTAIRLAPDVVSDVLHNSIKGYALGIEFNKPKPYNVYNNIIANTNQAFQIPTGAVIDTYNTVAYMVTTLRNGEENGEDFVVITSNPYFIDDALHISVLSPAIDAGSSVKTVKVDKDNNVRDEASPDIGAYEVVNY